MHPFRSSPASKCVWWGVSPRVPCKSPQLRGASLVALGSRQSCRRLNANTDLVFNSAPPKVWPVHLQKATSAGTLRRVLLDASGPVPAASSARPASRITVPMGQAVILGEVTKKLCGVISDEVRGSGFRIARSVGDAKQGRLPIARYGALKNSHMAGAVAASPGSLVTPRPSSMRRRTL
jgi:hypothetical protein